MIFFDIFAVVLCIIGAFYAWSFVISYGRDDWRRYEAGRHLMNFTRGLAVILSWSFVGLLLRAVLPDYPWIDVVLAAGRICIFGWVVYMLRSRYQLLKKAHASPERNRDGTSRQSV